MAKHHTRDAEWLRAGVVCAGQLVVHPEFLLTYQTAQMSTQDAGVKQVARAVSQIAGAAGVPEMMDAEMKIRRGMSESAKALEVTPAQWSDAFLSIGQQDYAMELFERAIDLARPALAAYPSELRDTLPDRPEFPPECSAAFRRTREHLLAHPQSPRWLALLLMTLARAIGSNARSGYASDTWHEGTLFWLNLERFWLLGDGAQVGALLKHGNRTLFSNGVAQNIGNDMPRRLAESSSLAPGWSLFQPPWDV